MYTITTKEFIVRGDSWDEEEEFTTLDEAIKWVKKEALDNYFKMEHIIKNDNVPVLKVIIQQRFNLNGPLPFKMEVEVY